MDGDITVSSIFGRGSTFRFDIPIKSDDLEIDPGTPPLTNPTGLPTVSPAASPLKILELPAQLMNELHAAVQNGEKDRLDELIRNVGNLDRQLGAALKQLAENYDYDALTCLLEDSQRKLLPRSSANDA
jgi:hypothetical protein